MFNLVKIHSEWQTSLALAGGCVVPFICNKLFIVIIQIILLRTSFGRLYHVHEALALLPLPCMPFLLYRFIPQSESIVCSVRAAIRNRIILHCIPLVTASLGHLEHLRDLWFRNSLKMVMIQVRHMTDRVSPYATGKHVLVMNIRRLQLRRCLCSVHTASGPFLLCTSSCSNTF